MIKEYEFYHGAAIARLIHSNTPVTVRLHPTPNNASYVINEKVGLYLKHSSSRMTPWGFTFLRDHQAEIDVMRIKYGKVVIGFVCHDDGIVGLTYDEFKEVLDDNHEDVEHVGISRKPREMFTVKGHDGVLRFKVGEGEFQQKVIAAIS